MMIYLEKGNIRYHPKAFSLNLVGRSYGCHLEILIRGDDTSTLKFLYLWKLSVDEGIVFGGPYKKSIRAEQEGKKLEVVAEKQSWELLPDNISIEKRKIVRLWCENKTAKEIAEIMINTEKVSYTAETVLNIISDLRSTFPKAGIPFDKKRKGLMQN